MTRPMNDTERYFHETWLGLVQPTQGLLVSIPALIDHQCMARAPQDAQAILRDLAPADPNDPHHRPRLSDLPALLEKLLHLRAHRFDRAEALPQALSLHVPEGKQTLRPTLALRRAQPPSAAPTAEGDPERTPAALAGQGYLMLLWDLAEHTPEPLDLDRPEHSTGPWDYPPAAKFERLLRHCRVPIGLLTNRREFRLIYAPHGESAGAITFRLADMLQPGGRPILDAFIMLLGEARWFAVAEEHALPAILAESRRRQAEVTGALAGQVLEALEILLAGFEAAADRDGHAALREAADAEGDHLYRGLLTVLLRLVFILFAEDRGLLPIDDPTYAEHYSVLGLFEQLQSDASAHPDAMNRRFGAWPRLLATWRAIFLGASHGKLHLPPRHGHFFDPNLYPFLEGWGFGGSSPLHPELYEQRAAVQVPSIDDGAVFQVLERLLFLGRLRLSYRALDVEQIGSVYEALMGYHVLRLPSRALCLRVGKNARVWVSAAELLALKKTAEREAFLKDTIGLAKAQASKLAAALHGAKDEDQALSILADLRAKNTDLAAAGRLVIQPGEERRRTSSHYTPQSLTEPVVRRTLAPLLAALGPEPSSRALLSLKICDPAMGSGAFLVAVVRALADQVVAAWTREGELPTVAHAHEDVTNHARRLVAQRCVYGVDKNPMAVNLAKLSLWLVTLSKDLPFTFVDHALRCGDSLVGLSLDQLRAFHWDPSARQQELVSQEIHAALEESIALRQSICDLSKPTDLFLKDNATSVRERERLLRDADDATNRVRLIGDLIIHAFFSKSSSSSKDRENARLALLDRVAEWIRASPPIPAPHDLVAHQASLHAHLQPLHWHLEFPEIFYKDRPDPLEQDAENHAALMDAFVGNPPFMGKNGILSSGGPAYIEWLKTIHPGAHGNADLSAHFFRRADTLLGAHGTIGLIATNTIGQGDTRQTGLQFLVNERDYTIYDATRNMPWPEEGAAVTISIVHLARGSTLAHCKVLELHDPDPDKPGDDTAQLHRRVAAINSRLRPTPERPDPKPLPSNAGLSFQGSIVLGMGFVLTPEERDLLVKKNPRNSERIFPYLGGEEVNTNPDQGFDRYVINFGQMELSEAEKWPDLLKIVREKVKPERDRQNDANGKKYWWQFLRTRGELYEAIHPLPRCLVTARTSKHTVFSFQPAHRVFSENLVVLATGSYSAFSVLSSRVHLIWVALTSSTLESRQGYRPSDCFETFPFPWNDPRVVDPHLEQLGQRLYESRAEAMKQSEQGLTKLYNSLKEAKEASDDPLVAGPLEPRLEDLRRQHEDLDRAVLAAYGWTDIEVPPFATPSDPKQRRTLEAFEDQIIDRLFALNAQRTQTPPPPQTPKTRKKPPKTTTQKTLPLD
jgi:hypothetical protein